MTCTAIATQETASIDSSQDQYLITYLYQMHFNVNYSSIYILSIQNRCNLLTADIDGNGLEAI